MYTKIDYSNLGQYSSIFKKNDFHNVLNVIKYFANTDNPCKLCLVTKEEIIDSKFTYGGVIDMIALGKKDSIDRIISTLNRFVDGQKSLAPKLSINGSVYTIENHFIDSANEQAPYKFIPENIVRYVPATNNFLVEKSSQATISVFPTTSEHLWLSAGKVMQLSK